jgi:isopentenyl-diphosphate delta-isomerase, type 1
MERATRACIYVRLLPHEKRKVIKMNDRVILVDENDRELGMEDKIRAHSGAGKLHRAFSLFIFNSKGNMLLQKRGENKYHSGGLWTNACCSHPQPGESLDQAAHRRLKEEMGFDCALEETFSFLYKANFDNGLTEWEFDHVFIGSFDAEIKADKNEVSEWKWVSIEELRSDISAHPHNYTLWFTIAIDRVLTAYTRMKGR